MSDVLEPPYTIVEVAKLLAVSTTTSLRLFGDEPGVLVFDNPETKHKRRYRTIRVPRTVFARVVQRLTR